jgi:5-deoxy-5-amino-3-dehydroquinate synthase
MTATVRVDLGTRSYHVIVGSGALAAIGDTLTGRRRVAIVTQTAIADAHLPALAAALDAAGIEHRAFTIDTGEDAKSLATVETLCESFAQWPLLRGDAVVALGGGMVGDVAGFTAAVYYRGVPVVQVPTTLLAMVDAAIGGKTGVNLPQGKNLVGAFHQPLAVLADPTVLATLPDREYRCGLGEVAKYALMGDADLTAILATRSDAVLARDPEVVADIVVRSAAIKAHYVALDEHETSGVRAHLNYGHTLAHGIETVAEYALAHGEAVAVGLVFAGALAGALERIDAAAVAAHVDTITRLGLPTRAPADLSRDDLLAVMQRDKKSSGRLTFVLAGPNGLETVTDPPAVAIDAAFAAVGL